MSVTLAPDQESVADFVPTLEEYVEPPTPSPRILLVLGVIHLLFGPAVALLNFFLVGNSIDRLSAMRAGPISTGLLRAVIWTVVAIGVLLFSAGIGLVLRTRWGRRLALVAAVISLFGSMAAILMGSISGPLATVEAEQSRMVSHSGPVVIRFVAAAPVFVPLYAILTLVLLNLPGVRKWAQGGHTGGLDLRAVPGAGGALGTPGRAAAAKRASVSTLAILSMIFAFIFPFLLLLPQIVSIILGFVALRRIKHSGGAIRGRAYALAGVSISSALLLLVMGCIAVAIGIWKFTPKPVALTEVQRREVPGGRITHLVYSPDGNSVVTFSADGTGRIWDARTAALKYTLEGTARQGLALKDDGSVCLPPAWAVTYSDHGNQLSAAFADGRVYTWDAQSSRQLHSFSLLADQDNVSHYVDLAFSADGRRLLACSSDLCIRLYDVSSGKETASCQLHGLGKTADDQPRLLRAALTPDGRRVFFGTDDHVLHLWDIDSGTEIQRFDAETYWGATAVACLPDGRRAVSIHTTPQHTAVVWDLETGQKIATFDKHRFGPTCLAVSQDGTRAVSGGRSVSEAGYYVISGDDRVYGHEVLIWNVKDGKEIHSFLGHKDTVSSVALAPDGRHVAAGSSEGTLILLELK